MSSPAPRPGAALGSYPERDPEREGALDRLLHRFRGTLARRRASRRAVLEAFVRQVREQEEALRDESEARFEERIAELRRRLLIDGLSDVWLPSAFAVIREVARRALGTPHYDVQLMGGWVMARGMLVEMETGEGKTLTATLPAATAALAGIPVHVISVNDYLVERDAEAMRPLYEALGLTVGAVPERLRDPAARRAAYACDITYGTAKQIGFDYLRDRLMRRGRAGRLPMSLERLRGDRSGPEQRLLRGLCFAIVDEADSVLIDEARTPLILAGAGESGAQRKTYRRALRLARALEQETHFRLDRAAGHIELTEAGRVRLEELAKPLSGFWAGPRRREEWVHRALCALHLFVRDRHYLVREEKVQIIDQPTGRVSPDRSWERGLHQLIEAKEGCPVTPERDTLARIGYQQLFRRYLRLAGMTGTAREVVRELWSVYHLNAVTIPTRLPVQRRDHGTRVFTTEAARWAAVVASVHAMHREGRPVLIGTASVAASEQLSALLTEQGLPHRVLNARQDGEEARIVAEAGGAGRITVATNMAGRGTDIRLAPGVAERGGLHVIATQRAEARRIDRQLYGRCGRQGDPGSHETLLSLEDEPVRHFYPRGMLRLLGRGSPERPLARGLGQALTWLPQQSEERRHARTRRSLVDLEEYLGDLLAFAGPGE